MENKMKNAFSHLSKEELESLLNSATCIAEIMDKFGLAKIGGNYKTLQRESTKNGLLDKYKNLSEVGKKRANLRRISKNKTIFEIYKEEEIFCEDSKVSRESVKKWILAKNLLVYKCRDCVNTGEWNNKKITLQLEHINGKNNDHRLENLCFLCPNCHSQTTTYGGKNYDRKKILSREYISADLSLKISKDVKDLKKEENEFREKRINIILNSGIDFSTFGWGVKLGKLLKISPQKSKEFVRKYMTEFYKEKCYYTKRASIAE